VHDERRCEHTRHEWVDGPKLAAFDSARDDAGDEAMVAHHDLFGVKAREA
jgi:hypothetical protein